MFAVGDLVICIDATIDADKADEITRDFQQWIEKGKKYIVRAIINHGFVVGILLEGVTNEPRYMSVVNKTLEPAFVSHRFRKGERSKLKEEVESEVLELN